MSIYIKICFSVNEMSVLLLPRNLHTRILLQVLLKSCLKKRVTNFRHFVTNWSTQAYDDLLNCCHKRVFSCASQTFKTTSRTLLHQLSQIFGNAVTSANWHLWQMFVVFSKAGIGKGLEDTNKWKVFKWREETKALRICVFSVTHVHICFANSHAF